MIGCTGGMDPDMEEGIEGWRIGRVKKMQGSTLFIKRLNKCFTVIAVSPVQNKTRKGHKKLI